MKWKQVDKKEELQSVLEKALGAKADLTVVNDNVKGITFFMDGAPVLMLERGGWEIDVFLPQPETVKKWKVSVKDAMVEYGGEEVHLTSFPDQVFDTVEEATTVNLALSKMFPGAKVSSDTVEVLK